jgi:hypothetical protein
VADTFSRPPASPVGLAQPTMAASSVKVPSESLVAIRWGGKFKSSSPSLVSLVTAFQGAVNFVDITANQLTCPSTVAAANSSSLSLAPVVIGGASVLCDMSTGVPRSLIPEANRWQVFAVVTLAPELFGGFWWCGWCGGA